MTLEEVNRIDNLSERVRAFAKLPKAEQDKLFSPAERIANEARDELYDRYAQRQRVAAEFIAQLVDSNQAARLTMSWVLDFIAAHELRCELAGVPTREQSPLPTLISREAIDRQKAVTRQELCEA